MYVAVFPGWIFPLLLPTLPSSPPVSHLFLTAAALSGRGSPLTPCAPANGIRSCGIAMDPGAGGLPCPSPHPRRLVVMRRAPMRGCGQSINFSQPPRTPSLCPLTAHPSEKAGRSWAVVAITCHYRVFYVFLFLFFFLLRLDPPPFLLSLLILYCFIVSLGGGPVVVPRHTSATAHEIPPPTSTGTREQKKKKSRLLTRTCHHFAQHFVGFLAIRQPGGKKRQIGGGMLLFVSSWNGQFSIPLFSMRIKQTKKKVEWKREEAGLAEPCGSIFNFPIGRPTDHFLLFG